MLEEGFLYNNMVEFFSQTDLSKTKTWGELQSIMESSRKTAGELYFPDLMARVNRGLTAPLHFEREFLSLQRVRNCLEHRDGVVTEKDVDPGTQVLRLGLPRLKLFYEEEGREIELLKGSHVEKDTLMSFKNVIEEREFKLGDRATFKAEEFHDIGFGCWVFTSDLGSKLPRLKDNASDDKPSL
jgi:hypothetical protein